MGHLLNVQNSLRNCSHAQKKRHFPHSAEPEGLCLLQPLTILHLSALIQANVHSELGGNESDTAVHLFHMLVLI